MDYKKSWEVLKETIEDWLEEEQDDNVVEAFEDILNRMLSLEEAKYRNSFSEQSKIIKKGTNESINGRLVSYKQIQEAKHLLQNEGYTVKRKIKENKSKVPTTIEFLNTYEDPQNYQNNKAAYDLVHKIMDKYGTFEEDIDVIYERMSDDDKIRVFELLK